MGEFDVFNPDTNRSSHSDSADIDSSNDTVPGEELPSQFVGKLEWSEKQRTSAPATPWGNSHHLDRGVRIYQNPVSVDNG